MDDRFLIGAGALFYLIGFLFALVNLCRSRRYEHWILYPLMATGFVIQTSGLYCRGLETGGCPLGNPFEILQFISWAIVFLYLFVGPALRLSILGFFSAALATGLAAISLAIPAWDTPSHNQFANPWIELHAASAIFSYGVFGLLALTSLMYLIQNYGLRNRRLRGLFSFLPSILELERVNRRLLLLGTCMLTFSMLLGSIYWLPNLDTVNISKLLITVLLWAAYALLFVLHKYGKLLSVRFAYACIGLFVFALITIFPVDRSRHTASSHNSKPAVLTQKGGIRE
jgi:HemX protein